MQAGGRVLCLNLFNTDKLIIMFCGTCQNHDLSSCVEVLHICVGPQRVSQTRGSHVKVFTSWSSFAAKMYLVKNIYPGMIKCEEYHWFVYVFVSVKNGIDMPIQLLICPRMYRRYWFVYMYVSLKSWVEESTDMELFIWSCKEDWDWIVSVYM